MKKCNLLRLPAFGVKGNGALTIWADARTNGQLEAEGFAPVNDSGHGYKYYGICLYKDMVLRAGSNDKDLIEKSGYGFYAVDTEDEATIGGQYLWRKKFGKEELLKPYGY